MEHSEYSRDIFTVPHAPSPEKNDPEPTLCDIFSAVTSCNMSVFALADELKW